MANVHLNTMMTIEEEYPTLEQAVKNFCSKDEDKGGDGNSEIMERVLDVIKPFQTSLDRLKDALDDKYSEDEGYESGDFISEVDSIRSELSNIESDIESEKDSHDNVEGSLISRCVAIGNRGEGLSDNIHQFKAVTKEINEVVSGAESFGELSKTNTDVEDDDTASELSNLQALAESLRSGINISSQARENALNNFGALQRALDSLIDDLNTGGGKVNRDDIMSDLQAISNAVAQCNEWFSTWRQNS